MSMNRFSRHVDFTYEEGESVLCFEPDPTKARVLYESRILERCVGRNSQGKLRPEYKIHFQGWSRTWDRNVSERLLLPYSSYNRKLMKKLHEVAKALRNNRRKKHLTILDILASKGIIHLESPIGSDAEDQESEEEEEAEPEEGEEDEGAEEEDRLRTKHKRKRQEVEERRKRKKRATYEDYGHARRRHSSPTVNPPFCFEEAGPSDYGHRLYRQQHPLELGLGMPVPTRRPGQRGRPRKVCLPVIADDLSSEMSSISGSHATTEEIRSGGGGDEEEEDDDFPIDSSSSSLTGETESVDISKGHGPEEELPSPDDGRDPPLLRPVPPIAMPLALAHTLTDVQTKIQLGDELFRLPCDPSLSVVTILEEYVQHFTYNLLSAEPKWNHHGREYRNLGSSGYGSGSESHPASSSGAANAGIVVERAKAGGALPKVAPACSVNLCKEVVDGLRIMFDNYIGPILLYKQEVPQFKKLIFYHKPVQPKKVLFPGPVIMPSRLRSQSRVGSGTPVVTTSVSSPTLTKVDPLVEAVVGRGAKTSASAIALALADKDDASSDTSSLSDRHRFSCRSDEEDKENEDGATEPGRDGDDRCSSHDGSATEVGSGDRLFGGMDAFGPSRLITDALIEKIEAWRLMPDDEVAKFPNTPSLLYGAHHFLRLFVHLPKLLSMMSDVCVDATRLNTILFHVDGILNYIDDNADVFLVEDFSSSNVVMDELTTATKKTWAGVA